MPPPDLVRQIGIQRAYGPLEASAAAKAARDAQGDPERARERARRAQADAYSFGLAEAMREASR